MLHSAERWISSYSIYNFDFDFAFIPPVPLALDFHRRENLLFSDGLKQELNLVRI